MKTLLLTAFIFLTTLCYSQQQKAPAIDTTKRDTTKTYALVLNEQEANALINIVKLADEKPSVIREWVQFISTRLQLLQPPKK